MATFTCEVVKLDISEHPNADAIEIANVGLFQSIVKKGEFKSGDLAVYIPEGSIVPENIIKKCHAWDETKQRGKLAGAKYNRVKAVKLRGILSQGLVCPLPEGAEPEVGDNLAEILGITKYDPNENLPASMRTRPVGELLGYTLVFDVENIKHPGNKFEEGNPVWVTEKIHGASCLIGVLPEDVVASKVKNLEDLYKGQLYLSTKRQSKRGVIISPFENTSVYVKALTKEPNIYEKILEYYKYSKVKGLVLLCEVFGRGVQDLTYNTDPKVLFFGGYWAKYNFVYEPIPTKELHEIFSSLQLPTVPLIYKGPYFKELLDKHTRGTSLICPDQIREGVVFRSECGNRLYKSVSEDYLLRKGNITEYD